MDRRVKADENQQMRQIFYKRRSDSQYEMTKNNKKQQKKTEVFSRIVGYLRPVSQWNEGKKAEFKLRTNFDLHKQQKKDSSPIAKSHIV